MSGALRCRPGDLARVLPPGRKISCPLCGEQALAVKPDTIVRVTKHDGIAWWLEEPITVNVSLPCGALIIARCTAIRDEALQPIRDPGDDAVDEMVKRVGPADLTPAEPREVAHG